MMNLELKEVDATAWQKLLGRSRQASPFVLPAFIESYEGEPRYLVWHKGQEPIAGIAVTASGGNVVQQPFHVHNGPLFFTESRLKASKAQLYEFQATEIIADYLFNQYENVRFSHHWDAQDMRPYQWYHYHTPEQGHYRVHLRYTSLLDLPERESDWSLRSGRREDLKRARKSGLESVFSDELAVFDNLHSATFEAQGIERSTHEVQCFNRLCKRLQETGSGKLVLTYGKGSALSGSFWALYGETAHYLFSGNAPEGRPHGAGTSNIVSAMEILRDTQQIRRINFVGVNSPARGDYKLSFGGNLQPYYEVEKVPPVSTH